MPPRLLFTLIFLLTLAFTLLSGLAKALGAQQPINPALEGFIIGCEDKPQPCWYGIVIGETTVIDAFQILSEQGFHTNDEHSNSPESDTRHYSIAEFDLVVHSNDSLVHAMILNSSCACAAIRFGELITVIGTPKYLQLDETRAGELDRAWFDNLIADFDFFSFGSHALSESIESLSFVHTSYNSPGCTFTPWHGFAPEWRYRQFEPTESPCI